MSTDAQVIAEDGMPLLAVLLPEPADVEGKCGEYRSSELQLGRAAGPSVSEGDGRTRYGAFLALCWAQPAATSASSRAAAASLLVADSPASHALVDSPSPPTAVLGE